MAIGISLTLACIIVLTMNLRAFLPSPAVCSVLDRDNRVPSADL